MPEMIREIRPSDIDVILAMSYVSEKFRDKELKEVIKLCDKLDLIYELGVSKKGNSLYLIIYKDRESLELGRKLQTRTKELTRKLRENDNVPDYKSLETKDLDKFFEINEIEIDGELREYAYYLVPIGVAKFRFSNHEQKESDLRSSESFSLLYQDLGTKETHGIDIPTDLKELERRIKQSINLAENVQLGQEAGEFLDFN